MFVLYFCPSIWRNLPLCTLLNHPREFLYFFYSRKNISKSRECATCNLFFTSDALSLWRNNYDEGILETKRIRCERYTTPIRKHRQFLENCLTAAFQTIPQSCDIYTSLFAPSCVSYLRLCWGSIQSSYKQRSFHLNFKSAAFEGTDGCLLFITFDTFSNNLDWKICLETHCSHYFQSCKLKQNRHSKSVHLESWLVHMTFASFQDTRESSLVNI